MKLCTILETTAQQQLNKLSQLRLNDIINDNEDAINDLPVMIGNKSVTSIIWELFGDSGLLNPDLAFEFSEIGANWDDPRYDYGRVDSFTFNPVNGKLYTEIFVEGHDGANPDTDVASDTLHFEIDPATLKISTIDQSDWNSHGNNTQVLDLYDLTDMVCA